jgi:hypothetical protein
MSLLVILNIEKNTIWLCFIEFKVFLSHICFLLLISFVYKQEAWIEHLPKLVM